jgi:hypothetical protein
MARKDQQTAHQRAEEELTAYGLSLPETDRVLDWGIVRTLRVTQKSFCVFGTKTEAADALTMVVKLPISAEMVQHLYYVREAKGWHKRHDWVTAHFGPDDDILAEVDTLKAWVRQSYVAMAPKRLGKLVV